MGHQVVWGAIFCMVTPEMAHRIWKICAPLQSIINMFKGIHILSHLKHGICEMPTTFSNITIFPKQHSLTCFCNMQCFLWKRNWILYIIYMKYKIKKGHVMHEVVTRRPLTMEARVRPRPVYVRFLVYTVPLEQVFLLLRPFVACQYHSPNTPYSSLSSCCCHSNGQAGKTWEPPKSIRFRKWESIGYKSTSGFLRPKMG